MTVLKTTYGSLNAALTAVTQDVVTYTAEVGATQTLSTDEFINGVYHQTDGGTPGTHTSPTAAECVAAIQGCVVGTSWDFMVHNDDAVDTLTVAGGTGVAENGTMTVLATKNRVFRCVVTNVGSGTEAVEMFGLAESV